MHRLSSHQLAQRPKHGSPLLIHRSQKVATERFRGLLAYFTLDQTNRIEGIFEDIGEPVPWPSTI